MGSRRGDSGADAREMDPDTALTCCPQIDDHFLAEWVQFGMIQLGAYLAGQAKFARYCDQRDAPGFRLLDSAILRVAHDD